MLSGRRPFPRWDRAEYSRRSSNVIESSFATMRHRTDRTKRCPTRDGMLAMIYKLGLHAERSNCAGSNGLRKSLLERSSTTEWSAKRSA